MKQSFEAVLVRQCALTLAGMKPGSLFCFPAPSMEEPRSQTEQWDRRLCPLGLSARVLLERPGAGSALICGLWKSYGDPSAMEKCFACYRTCAARCVRLYEQGAPIEALAAQA